MLTCKISIIPNQCTGQGCSIRKVKFLTMFEQNYQLKARVLVPDFRAYGSAEICHKDASVTVTFCFVAVPLCPNSCSEILFHSILSSLFGQLGFFVFERILSSKARNVLFHISRVAPRSFSCHCPAL